MKRTKEVLTSKKPRHSYNEKFREKLRIAHTGKRYQIIKINIDEVKNKYIDGYTLLDLAKEYNCSTHTIRRRLISINFNDFRKNRKHTEETKQKIGKYFKGRKQSVETIKKRSKSLKGIKRTKEWKEKIGIANSNKHPSDISRQKMRESRISYIEKQFFECNKMSPCIGKYETQILDILEVIFDYKILRQYNILGYFLDGYCPALNLAIEIDESHHKKQHEKDTYREGLIKNELNCSFLRISV